MKGDLYILSRNIEYDEIVGKAVSKFKITIRYDDLQFISTEITVKKEHASFLDCVECVKEYFKGEITYR